MPPKTIQDNGFSLPKLSATILERDNLFQYVLEAIPDPFIIYDIAGKVTYLNPAFTDLFGWQIEECINRKMDAFVPQENWPETQKMIDKVLAGESFSDIETRRYTRDGVLLDVSISGSIYRDQNGKPLGSVINLRDITEKKRAVEALRESEDRYRLLMEAMADAVVVYDAGGRVTYVNSAFEQVYGWSRDELLQKNIPFVPEHEQEKTNQALDRTLKGEKILFETQRITKDGKLLDIQLSSAMYRDLRNRIAGMIVIHRDTTHSKRAEEALRVSEERYRSVMEAVPDPIIVYDIEGRVTYFNPAFSRVFGWSLSERIGQKMDSFVPPENWPETTMMINKVLAGESFSGIESTRLNKYGKRIPVSISGSIYKDKNENPLGSVINLRDITARKKAEEALRESENRYRILMETTPDAVVVYDQNGDVTYANTAFEKIYGWSRDELVNRQIDFVPSAEESKTNDAIRRTLNGEEMLFETQRLTKNGNMLEVQLKSTIYPNRDGNIGGIIVVHRDISERKKAEKILQEAKETAESANRAKSEFIASMSHEIRTPMNAILGFTEILEKQIEKEEHKQHLSAISSSGTALLSLINDILDLSKIEAGKLRLTCSDVDPISILTEIKHIFSQKVRQKGLEFRLKIDPSLSETVSLDEIRLRQILFNLVGNAVKFTHSGSITLGVRKMRSGLSQKHLDLQFFVQDTGIGISKDQHQNIFNAFEQQIDQTSPAAYGGTGLGLDITRRLVQLMGGEIAVESELGKGSTFRVYLRQIQIVPQSDRQDLSEQSKRMDTIQFQDATILLVDDIANNRSLITTFLCNQNIEIIEARNGREAVELTRLYRPDLILMDMKMPVMDGYQATEILKHDENLYKIPIIAITAAALPQQEAKMRMVGCDRILIKPIRKEKLIAEIAGYLPYFQKGASQPVHPPTGQDLSEALSDAEKQQLPELKEQMRQIWLPRWEKIHNTFYMEEIKAFGEQIMEVGASYNLSFVRDWGKTVTNQAKGFQLEKLQKSLNDFRLLLQKIDFLLKDSPGQTGEKLK